MTTLELKGITHELTFWKGFVKSDRFIGGWVAPIKTPELNNKVAQFIIDATLNSETKLSVLDVGSGAVSILNGLPVNVTAADPLGGLYQLIFDYDKYSLDPPIAIPAEELQYENTFDIVHCSNALDHSQNPLLALNAMIRACKPKGFLIIQGFENEAEHEHYQGFHQWNLQMRLSDGVLIIKDKHTETHVHADFIQSTLDTEVGFNCQGVFCSSELLPQKKDWFIWIIQKL